MHIALVFRPGRSGQLDPISKFREEPTAFRVERGEFGPEEIMGIQEDLRMTL
jgi:hypothetical protein